MNYSSRSKLWKYSGKSAWYFITLPSECTDELKALRNPVAKNFGSIRVKATIEHTIWCTSTFPDSHTGAFLLPVKKEVRTKNNLRENQVLDYQIEIDTSGL